MALITNAALEAQIDAILVAWETHQAEFQDWIGGTVGGGAGLDGKYPLTDRDAAIRLTLCPAQLENDVSGPQGLAEAAQAAAEAAQAAAEAAATTSTTQATNAATARTAAELAETHAETAETSAQNEAANALTSANNAATSETNAAASETAAGVSETNANLSKNYATEWANAVEDLLVSAAAGGDQVDDYSAMHHAIKAAASAAAAATFDPALYAALADNETVIGAWTFANDLTLSRPGAAGDVRLIIEADSDNVTEASGAELWLAQDGQLVCAYFRTVDTNNIEIGSSAAIGAYTTPVMTWAYGSNALTIPGTLTVTGQLNASASIVSEGVWHQNGTTPKSTMIETDWTADYKRWDTLISSGVLSHRLLNDAQTVATTYMSVARTGTVANQITLAATELQFDGTTLDVNAAADISGTLSVGGTSATITNAASVALNLRESGEAVDEKNWDILVSGSSFYMRALNDALSVGVPFLRADRTSTAIDLLTLTATELQFDGTTLDINAAADFSSTVTAASTITGDSYRSTNANGSYRASADTDNLAIIFGLSYDSSINPYIRGWGGTAVSGAKTLQISTPATGGSLSITSPTISMTGATSVTGALTATSFGGITSANLVDKSAAEAISAAWDFGDSLGAYYGIDGGYSTHGASSAFGATIWALDASWRGGIAGDSSVDTNVYGLKWKRTGHANANSRIGEGIYVIQAGVHKGGIGTVGMQTAGTLYTGGAAYFAGDIIGHFEAVTGNYGSVQVAGFEGSSGAWAGYSINGRHVFMGDNSTQCGIYNDVNNQWHILCTDASDVALYHNNTEMARTITAATGGFQVNNTSTGAGFERVLTTSDLVIVAPATIKVKTADESVTASTTMQDDNHLASFSLVAGKWYAIEGSWEFTAPNITPDIKFQFVFSNAPNNLGHYAVNSTDITGQNSLDGGSSMTTVTIIQIASRETQAHVHGAFQANSTTGGTLKLQWAQNVSNASATTMLAGSWLRVTQLN